MSERTYVTITVGPRTGSQEMHTLVLPEGPWGGHLKALLVLCREGRYEEAMGLVDEEPELPKVSGGCRRPEGKGCASVVLRCKEEGVCQWTSLREWD